MLSPDVDYFAIDAWSRSQITRATTGRMQDFYDRYVADPPLIPEDTSPALRFGTALHKLILEPDSFADDYRLTEARNRKLKGFKTAEKTWKGYTVLPRDEWELLAEMRRAVVESPFYERFLQAPGPVEKVFTWTDEETGEKLKCKPDKVVETPDGAWVIDLKSAIDYEMSKFEWSCWKYGYAVQAAHYIDGVSRHYPAANGFIFICVSKSTPIRVRAYEASHSMITKGFLHRDEALARIAECKKSGDWTDPGQDHPIVIGANPLEGVFDDS